MKFRKDFVTNSSSSSFIIGKYGDGIDKNTVYELVRHIYKEFLDIKKRLMPVAKDYGICWDVERECFTYIKFGKITDELRAERKEINARLKKDFGVELCDLYFYHNFEWLKCETYDDFVEFFGGKDAKDAYGFSMRPFDIIDFEKETEMPDGKLFKDSFDYQEIIDWYLPCVLFPSEEQNYDLEGNYIGECGECPFNHNKEACEKFKSNEKEGKYTKETLVCKVLGKIGVISYCGYIPEYVVEKLGAKSNVYCNHMG